MPRQRTGRETGSAAKIELKRLTNHCDDALVAWYGLLVVAFSPLERLGEIHGRLVRLPSDVQLVNAALGDH
jgi:hypothetical protein